MSTDTDYDAQPWAGMNRIREVKPQERMKSLDAVPQPEITSNISDVAKPRKPKRRSLLSRLNAVVTLQVTGLAAIATAFGMWELPVGVGVGGLAALVLAWDMGSDRGGV